MGVLAVYDTVGIQNYIFSSNKLAENVGASKLVADIFAEMLPQIIAEITETEIFRWKDHENKTLSENFIAEVIYEGGGNAYVAFDNECTFRKVTREFLMHVNSNVCDLGIAVAAIETDFANTYKDDFRKLNDRLSLVKGGFNVPVHAGNQPITKQSTRTGLPVSYIDKNIEYISEAQKQKRTRYDEYRKEMKQDDMDFDDLAFDKGSDSLIAIIHADGNNLGATIQRGMANFDDYCDAVPRIRQLSKEIHCCYHGALERTKKAFEGAYEEYVATKQIEFPNKSFSKTPLLELICDGDDITLLICGRFALDFAVHLLHEIEGTSNDNHSTACAGVILFNSHYPFSEAYKLVEDLCANAKKNSRTHDGSYIDFHLHQSGRAVSLDSLRDRLYNVNGKSLLRRPWRITKGFEDEFPNFSWFAENIAVISDMPRNKTKLIRNAIGIGDEEAQLAINQLQRKKWPDFMLKPAIDKKTNEVIMSDYAAHFDILEMADAYVNLLNKGGAGDDK